jgi:hypothetical protein
VRLPVYAPAAMATEAVTAADESLDASNAPKGWTPYAPSWVDRLIGLVERLPGPTWLAYGGVAAVIVALSVSLVAFTPDPEPAAIAANAFWGLVLPLTLWLVHYLAGVAGAALDAFRPSLTASDEEAARLRHELTVIPATAALGILVFAAIFTPAYWVVDPQGSAVVGLTPVALVGRFFSETFFGALLMAFAYQSIRQLRAVARIHSSATRVDLFRPAPLYAFSVLTSRTAIVMAFVFTVPTAVAASQSIGNGTDWFIGWAGVGVALSIVVFVVPLLGMRRRITAEKARLQGEVGARIETTIGAVHDAVDAGDMAGAASMHDTLGVLIAERELVDKLPTLPWRPGTLGAVLTAIALPLGLSVASRLLERVF